tara:strand:+ start:374 stop:586 length:213 start_codon:yes stop_codon:yes gene_type:complete
MIIEYDGLDSNEWMYKDLLNESDLISLFTKVESTVNNSTYYRYMSRSGSNNLRFKEVIDELKTQKKEDEN